MINADGVNSLVNESKSPDARTFRNWLAHEIAINNIVPPTPIPEVAESQFVTGDVMDCTDQVESTGLQIFNHDVFGKIRTIDEDGEPWFVGKDVAEALGYGKGKSLNNAIYAHVNEEDKGVTEMMTPGGKQNMTIINESGLYSLIMGSKLPSAKDFKRWVTSEVLPSIRKHGAYMTPDVLKQSIADPSYMIGILSALNDEQHKSQALEAQLALEAPLVDFAKSLLRAEENITLGEFAKSIFSADIKIGQNRMYKFLRSKGVFDEHNIAYQKHIDNGNFFIQETSWMRGFYSGINLKTLITPKGQEWFIKKYKQEG